MRCSRCGVVSADNMQFCPACGMQLGGSAAYNQAPSPGYSQPPVSYNTPPPPYAPSYGQPGYSPQSPYPPQQPGYPTQPGYPAQPGYPTQPGYPSAPQQPGYPPQGAYPPQPQGGYPPQQQGAYPPPQQQAAYPPTVTYPAQPGAQAAYPPKQANPQGAYPPQQQANPQGAYPPQQVQPQGAYPPQQVQGAYPNVPQAGYPYVQGSAPPFQAQPIGRPTVVPFPNFNANADADALKKAMKGLGSDHQAIAQIIGHRTTWQLTQVAVTYKGVYGKDLIEKLESELGGDFMSLIRLRFYPPDQLDAWSIHKAMEGTGYDHEAMIEIICTRTNQQIHALKAAYHAKFGRNLDKDISSETSGDFRKLAISLLQGVRDENPVVNVEAAKADAHALFNAGEGRWGTDESTFNKILASRSYPQLNAIFNEYAKISSHDISKAIEREMSGDLRLGMLAIVRVVRGIHDYFAHQLYHAMKGLGTNDRTLKRIVASRCEVDMVEIKESFQRQYQKSLAKWIESETSGDYRKLLLMLIAA